MRARILKIVLVSVVASLSTPTLAEVTVKDAWVRATPGNAKVTAAYAVLVNTGAADDVLIGVSALSAGMAHLHASEGEDGVMRMDSVEKLPIPAKKEVALAPGNYHVMIMGLKAPLKVGEEIPLTFSFQHQGDVDVKAKVMPLAYQGVEGSMPVSHEHHK